MFWNSDFIESGAEIIDSSDGLALYSNSGGSVHHVVIQGFEINCSNLAEDASGNLLAGVLRTFSGSIDVTGAAGDGRDLKSLRSDLLGEYDSTRSEGDPAFRTLRAGQYFSTVAIDPGADMSVRRWRELRLHRAPTADGAKYFGRGIRLHHAAYGRNRDTNNRAGRSRPALTTRACRHAGPINATPASTEGQRCRLGVFRRYITGGNNTYT